MKPKPRPLQYTITIVFIGLTMMTAVVMAGAFVLSQAFNASIVGMLMWLGGAVLMVLGMVALIGPYVGRIVSLPLEALTQTINQIVEGADHLQAIPDGSTETVAIGEAINHLTSQFQAERVALVTQTKTQHQRLINLAAISEKLTSILELELLLESCVTLLQVHFQYEHVHLYLLDEEKNSLIFQAGVGSATSEMKQEGYSIALTAENHVAIAVRKAETVIQNDITKPTKSEIHPQLAGVHAELAIPILLHNKTVGVLSVLMTTPYSFTEDEAIALRVVTSQVAMGIRNAQLFAETSATLAKAKAVQAQYQEQTWRETRHLLQNEAYYHYQTGQAIYLDKSITAQLRQQAQAQTKPIIVEVDDLPTPSLVAPVRLADQSIGSLQLHQPKKAWTEDEMVLVEMVLDQVAQRAEMLRLFHETRERATREQDIRAVTDKLRTASTMNMLLETAAVELGARLGARHTIVQLGLDAQDTVAKPAESEG